MPDVSTPIGPTYRISCGFLLRGQLAAHNIVIETRKERTEGLQVEAALASVPTGFRLVLCLVDGEDLTYADIASILDVSVETVASAVRLARSVFGEQLLLRAGTLRRDRWSRQARP